ncbi:UNVERIFIED_CONTAM: hypothetical protein Slati_1462200 [Sesamum latifolium]|uniref:Uncharacterized protein n=1 Tax=Sesamum latifolium TaxID=2727402 RepID=A0AAW2X5F0_9LAMI
MEQPRGSTGESPFSLVYGTEATIPAELGMPSHRVMNFSEECNAKLFRESPDLIEELRERAFIRIQRYKNTMINSYNKRVKARSFQVGDLVLRRVNTLKPVGKLDPTWEGPYKVGSSLSFEAVGVRRGIPFGTSAVASGGTSERPSLAARETLSPLPSSPPSPRTSPSTDSVAATGRGPSLPPPLLQEDYRDPPLQNKEHNQITPKKTGMTPNKTYKSNNKHTYPTLGEDPPQQELGDWRMSSALEGRRSAYPERGAPHQQHGFQNRTGPTGSTGSTGNRPCVRPGSYPQNRCGQSR